MARGRRAASQCETSTSVPPVGIPTAKRRQWRGGRARGVEAHRKERHVALCFVALFCRCVSALVVFQARRARACASSPPCPSPRATWERARTPGATTNLTGCRPRPPCPPCPWPEPPSKSTSAAAPFARRPPPPPPCTASRPAALRALPTGPACGPAIPSSWWVAPLFPFRVRRRAIVPIAPESGSRFSRKATTYPARRHLQTALWRHQMLPRLRPHFGPSDFMRWRRTSEQQPLMRLLFRPERCTFEQKGTTLVRRAAPLRHSREREAVFPGAIFQPP